MPPIAKVVDGHDSMPGRAQDALPDEPELVVVDNHPRSLVASADHGKRRGRVRCLLISRSFLPHGARRTADTQDRMRADERSNGRRERFTANDASRAAAAAKSVGE